MKTMKQLRNLTMAALLALSTITVTSCVSNDNGGPDTNGKFTALVTYDYSVPATESGNTATAYYTYYGLNDAQPVIMLAKYDMPSSIKKGQRCVIGFNPADYSNPLAGGPVTVTRCLGISTTTVETAPTATAQAANAPINLLYTSGQPALSRTGNYINIEAYMPYVEDRTFTIVADEATVNTAMPDLYLTTTASQPTQGITNATLGSIDIQSVWRRPDVQGVRIHINNSNPNYPEQKTFEFKK